MILLNIYTIKRKCIIVSKLEFIFAKKMVKIVNETHFTSSLQEVVLKN